MMRIALLLVILAACRRDAPSTSGTSGSDVVTTVPPVVGPAPKPTAKEPEPEIPDAAATKAFADTACPRVAKPFFFRVEKAGHVAHLLGTRHLSVSLAKMPAAVRDQLLAAKLVVFETPPGDDGGDMPAPAKPLSAELGPKLWDKYKHLVGEEVATGVDTAPIAVAMISMLMLYEDQTAKLDSEIEELVKGAHIETGGLESSAFQDKLLGELMDLRMLKAAITGTADRNDLKHEAVDDIAEYCAGTDETPGMDDRTKKQLKAGGYTDAEIATLDDKLLNERNADWMPKLEKLFAKDGVFVVVGADHLTGPRGVIAQLGARGFKASRIAP
ncbi:MAG: TraB/GumN family protein [Kofleriaceae bacterium]